MVDLNPFSPATYEQWRQMVEEDLEGASFDKKLVTSTYEGIAIQPLYSKRDWDSHREAPYVRGVRPVGTEPDGWQISQIYDAQSGRERTANSQIVQDLKGGVNAVELRVDSSTNWDTLLSHVYLNMIHVSLDAGADFAQAADALMGAWEKSGTQETEMRGAFHADPLGVIAREGGDQSTLQALLSQMSELAKKSQKKFPSNQVNSVQVSTRHYYEAGCNEAQDLAFAMATGVEYLRVLTQAGLTLSQAAAQMEFSFSLGTHFFMSIAKLRAARKLWGRIIEVCAESESKGVQASQILKTMKLTAQTSDRMMTIRDPWVNMLRTTVAAFAGAVAGADRIQVLPFDSRLGGESTLGRRIARNTQHILQEESSLHKVMDPAGGSWAIEVLTEQLSEFAWKIFQEIEKQGGISRALSSGWVQSEIEKGFEQRLKNIKRRKDPLTGVSEFPHLREEALPNAQALTQKSGLGSDLKSKTISAIKKLPIHHLAEPFEELRDASDRYLAKNGVRPKIFLANLGSISQHIARAMFAQNFFESGGIEALGNAGFTTVESAVEAFKVSGAYAAVLCSSDQLYPQYVAELAPALKQAGAKIVFLAGKGGENEEAWKKAGVDGFIYMGCDVWQTLQDLHSALGVSS